ncbi:glycosyltransferase family 4 protein [Halorubrum ezzemoulense]|uniref:glycosyltransferase family 4 protein n=1 Tax=Halorubrum ezzemoulense TaxID=337243 RepID=UPI00232C6B62|nr:glycosyltransferase family 4 protein [Halorubrum ezzemoulense]MDB9235812.1 glycosyltransferase family 4 protein [Halorubrum ezzemoulense]
MAQVDTNTPRVLHLITRFLGGGAETTTINALDALRTSSREYDLRLGTGESHDPDRLARLEEDGIDTVVFKSIRHYNPFTAAVAVISVARYLQREQIDILHTHSTEAGIIGRFASRLVNVPVVIHEIHGDPITPDRNRMLNAVICWLERAATTEDTNFIDKSNNIKQTFLERGIGTPSQYTTIYHGVKLERFRTANPIHDCDVPVVLFVGRLSEGKGLSDLLTAVSRIKNKTQFRLLIAGDGPLSGEIETQAESLEIDDIVELLGYREDIPALMASADILALPSYREGTPRVITEALAAGTPVISTAIAGIPDQVSDGETGFLIEPGEIDVLTDRIQKLLTNVELRREMGKQAVKSVAKFSEKEAQERYRDLYTDILNNNSDY